MYACTSGIHMPGMVMLAFPLFLPSYPLDHVSRLSKRQNARHHEKTAPLNECVKKIVCVRNIVSYWSPNFHFIAIISPFIKLCTKCVHDTIKYTQHTTKRPKIQMFRSKETDLDDLGTNPKQ